MRGAVKAALAPRSALSIAAFRIAFGLIIAWEVFRYFEHGWIEAYYIRPSFHFTYFGFGWVKPWPGVGMYVHFGAVGVAALLVAAGAWYRVSSTVLWLGFSYIFLLDEARYLNHFYAALLFAFVLVVIPANRALSVDAKRRALPQTIPAWSIWLLRAQVGVIYFFGGIAKLNPDWLRGEPMRTWLLERSANPVIGLIVANRLELLVFSYGGLLFDLLVVPALLWRRTRPFAFAAAVVFHLINSQLFAIGIFPFMMMAATTVFFEPDWPRALGGRVETWTGRKQRPRAASDSPAVGSFSTLPPFHLSAFLALYLVLQVVIPLRHFLYPGDVAWTEEGHRFSWRMKLRDKEGTARFFVTDSRTRETTVVEAAAVLEPWQASEMAGRPEMVLQFAHHLADEHGGRDHPVEVRAQVVVALNGAESRLLVDPRVNLAAEHRTLWPATWITHGDDVRDVFAPR